GGEITVLDPAGYGAVTITKSVSIVNDGVGEAGVTASANINGIDVSTGPSDVVNLRGLTVVGDGVGLRGIALNLNGTLNIQNCVSRGFSSGGITLLPNASLTLNITDTIVSNIGTDAIAIISGGQGTLTLNRVQAIGNRSGFSADETNSTASAKVTIANST